MTRHQINMLDNEVDILVCEANAKQITEEQFYNSIEVLTLLFTAFLVEKQTFQN